MVLTMSSVMEIESAIRELPASEFWKLSTWFDELRAKAWGEQMESDAKAGKLDSLFEEAKEEREAASLNAWPEAK
jgi:hypothetical protein